MTPPATSKAVYLVAANVVAVVLSGVAFMTVIFNRGDGLAAIGRGKPAIFAAAATVGLTLLLLLVAAARRERPLSGYLSALSSLVLFVVVSWFAFAFG